MNGKLLYIVSKNIKRVNHLYVENEKKMHYRMNLNCCGATRHRRRRAVGNVASGFEVGRCFGPAIDPITYT